MHLSCCCYYLLPLPYRMQLSLLLPSPQVAGTSCMDVTCIAQSRCAASRMPPGWGQGWKKPSTYLVVDWTKYIGSYGLYRAWLHFTQSALLESLPGLKQVLGESDKPVEFFFYPVFFLVEFLRHAKPHSPPPTSLIPKAALKVSLIVGSTMYEEYLCRM